MPGRGSSPKNGSEEPAGRDKGTVLVVEDDPKVRDLEERFLRAAGFKAQAVATAEEALFLVARRAYDAILTDLQLPGMSGMDLLDRFQDLCPGTPVVVVTGSADLRTAITCMRRGAIDFLAKPLDPELLAVTVEKAVEHGEIAGRLAALESASSERSGLGRLLGRSPSMKRLFTMIRRAAPHDTPVLILGESGSGKELAAREIHRLSARADKPLLTVSCANITPTLQESEFFGHEKGAFTGADAQKRGLFEAADGGTILLDEVAECAPPTQASLLRVLQEGEIRRVGSIRAQKVDVRVIAATNADLEKRTASGEFRSDLYYRLSRVVIEMPPLRDRPEDVVMLAEGLLAAACERLGRPARHYSPRALEMLVAYRWPGNVRELENLSEKVALFTDREVVRPADLQGLSGWSWSEAPRVETLEELERRHVREVLNTTLWNYKQAAHLLGIPRSTLYRMVRRHGLAADLPEDADAEETGSRPALAPEAGASRRSS